MAFISSRMYESTSSETQEEKTLLFDFTAQDQADMVAFMKLLK